MKGKTVVVGVCGGIAAYKVVEVVSRLRKLNAEVHVIMTESAMEFVAPLTFQSLSNNPVVTDMFAEPRQWDVEHISLARKADLIVVAPATANVIGKVAGGIADDMLSTVIMATKATVLFVPAMNPVMYENPILQANKRALQELGYGFMEPDTGLMAAEGEYGKGRLPEPKRITEEILSLLLSCKDLEGLNILITAGPTREPIDPVRYISNHSSGKMGYALAEAARNRGASVTLVSGPVNISRPARVDVVDVNTADEMLEAVLDRQEGKDVFIMVAAVADYKCAVVAGQKIKKAGETMAIELVRNPDIAAEVGKMKGNRILVGFSAETHNLENNSREKLARKNLDMIVANDVTQAGAGFGTDTNIVKLILKDGSLRELPMLSKYRVAEEILDEIKKLVP